MRIKRFSNLLRQLKKSSLPAKKGQVTGKYPFFTSSPILSNFMDTHQYSGECIIIGTGGNPSIHYYNGRFSVSSHCLVYQLNETELLNLKYIYYYLSKNLELFEQGFKGAGLKNISSTFINGITIPVPTFGEQNRIVQVFDKANNILNLRKKAIVKISNYITYDLFADFFGDTYTNSMSWPTIELEKLCERVIDCPHSTPLYSDNETQYPCLRSSDIQNGFIELATTKYVNLTEYTKRTQRYKPKIGDIIYCREGARFGNAAIIQSSSTACLGQRMMLFTPHVEKSNSWFLSGLLNSNGIYFKAKEKAGGAGSPHVNVGDIRKFQVINPPKRTQDLFGETVAVAYQSRNKMLVQHDEIKAFIESLSASAFKKGGLKTEVSAFSFDDQVVEYIERKDESIKNIRTQENRISDLKSHLRNEFDDRQFSFHDLEGLNVNFPKYESNYLAKDGLEAKGFKDVLFELLEPRENEDRSFLEQVFLLDDQIDAAQKKDFSKIVFKINNANADS